MRKVKVKTAELLEKVTANRGTHIEEYEEAVEGYKEAAMAEIERGMDKLKQAVQELQGGETLQLAAVHFNLQVPQNHSKDYDQVIEMLRMSVDDEMEIQSDEFACYVMDDWDWKTEHINVSNVYKNRC